MQSTAREHFPCQAGLRSLKQSTLKFTVVRTPKQLLDAVSRGDAHIEIRQHLDLTMVTPLGGGAKDNVPNILSRLPPSVQSIRVRDCGMLQTFMHSQPRCAAQLQVACCGGPEHHTGDKVLCTLNAQCSSEACVFSSVLTVHPPGTVHETAACRATAQGHLPLPPPAASLVSLCYHFSPSSA
jgi:hypothetical protein